MFNGSENFNDDYFKVLEKIGATDLNGTTNEDRTNYFQNVPSPALDTGAVDGVRPHGPPAGRHRPGQASTSSAAWSRTRSARARTSPTAGPTSLIQTGTYPKGHPYSWTVIGSMEDLDGRQLDDVKEWFRTYYGAANAMLVVAGDVTARRPGEGREVLRRHPAGPAGDSPGGLGRQAHGQPAPDHAGPRAAGAHLQGLEHAGPRHRGRRGARPGRAHPGPAGKTSRLYKRLVYDDQIATQRDGHPGSGARSRGQFSIDATRPARRRPRQVERAIDEELARFLEKGPTADELERGPHPVPGRLHPRRRAHRRLRRQVRRAGPEPGLRRLARRLQDAPAPRARGHGAAGLGRGPALARRTAQYVLTVHPLPEHAAASAGVDRKQKPEPGLAPEPKFPAFTRATLTNGLKLIVAERHAVPVVDFSLLVDAGYASDQLGLPGTAKLAADMLDEGTKTRSSLEISEQPGAAGRRAVDRGQPRHDHGLPVGAQGQPGPVARRLRRRGPRPGLPREGLRAAQEAAAGGHRAREGRAHPDGAARPAAAALRPGPRLRQPAHRLGQPRPRWARSPATTW